MSQSGLQKPSSLHLRLLGCMPHLLPHILMQRHCRADLGWIFYLGLANGYFCAKAFWGPRSPETTPIFAENPALPRNLPRIPIEFILSTTLNSTEFPPKFLEFPRFHPHSRECTEISGKSGEERNSRNQPLAKLGKITRKCLSEIPPQIYSAHFFHKCFLQGFVPSIGPNNFSPKFTPTMSAFLSNFRVLNTQSFTPIFCLRGRWTRCLPPPWLKDNGEEHWELNSHQDSCRPEDYHPHQTLFGFGKGVFCKRGLFRKVHFLEILDNLEILEFLGSPQTEKERRFRPFSRDSKEFRDLEILEISPAKKKKKTFRNDAFSGPDLTFSFLFSEDFWNSAQFSQRSQHICWTCIRH